MDRPRVILWDLETSHNIVAAFQLRQHYAIPHDNILQERYIICAAWKELGHGPVHSAVTLRGNDKSICVQLHRLLSRVDVAIAHNGDAFDLKFVETRMVFHGLPPLPPLTTIDTLKVARKRFRFNNNRLDYLGKFLGVGAKHSTSPGLWVKVLRQDPSAIRALAAYNKHDVILLERVFRKLQPYTPTRLIIPAMTRRCVRCGSPRVHFQGERWSRTGAYQRLRCRSCGGWEQIPKLVIKCPTHPV